MTGQAWPSLSMKGFGTSSVLPQQDVPPCATSHLLVQSRQTPGDKLLYEHFCLRGEIRHEEAIAQNMKCQSNRTRVDAAAVCSSTNAPYPKMLGLLRAVYPITDQSTQLPQRLLLPDLNAIRPHEEPSYPVPGSGLSQLSDMAFGPVTWTSCATRACL